MKLFCHLLVGLGASLVGTAFTSAPLSIFATLNSKTDKGDGLRMSTSNDAYDSSRRKLLSSSVIAATFGAHLLAEPNEARASDPSTTNNSKKPRIGGLAHKIRNVGNVMVG